MKKLLLLSTFAFLSYYSEAKIALSLEAGAGFGSSGAKYNMGAMSYMSEAKRTVRPAFGATISYSKHRMFFGAGVRYWSGASNYSDAPLFDVSGSFIGRGLVNTVNNISIPIHAGFHFPLKKMFIEAKVKAGPSFISQELSVDVPMMKDNDMSIADNSILFVGGADLGIGTRIPPRTQLQLKYSFMSALADVKYDPIPHSFLPFAGTIESGKPNMHALMLELSLAL